jgi:fatty acid desaturase
MTSVWKTKVLPGLSKIFDKDGKKAAAVEFLKTFNKVWSFCCLCVVYMFLFARLLIVWVCYVYM